MPELRTRSGMPTGAVYGFLAMLHSLLDEYQPQFLVVAFDRPEPTFRHEVYADYKSNRVAPPEDLVAQFPVIKEVLSAMHVPALEIPGFEADDIIGSLSGKAAEAGFEVVVVTGDKDLLQLVEPRVKVLQSHYKNSKLYGEKEVQERYKISPSQLPDLFGLMGDKSDDIPGVPGIGEKTAGDLIGTYGCLENLYDRIDGIGGKRKQNLIEFREQAFLSRDLAKIKTDLDIDLLWDDARFSDPDIERLGDLYRKMEFRTLLAKLSKKQKVESSGEYRTVATGDDLEDLCTKIRKSNSMLALDTETTSLDPMQGVLVGISLSFEKGKGFYIPVGHTQGNNLSLEDVKRLLGPILSDDKIKKCGHHLKFDSAFLVNAGMPLKGIAYNTLLASQLLEPEASSHKLDELALSHLQMKMIPIEELIGSGRSQKSMADVEIDLVSPYACEDADATLQLYEFYRGKIEEEKLQELFYEIELPLIDVLRDMEIAGVSVDAEELKRQSEELGKDIDHLVKKIQDRAGVEFNLNSPKQLGEVLFDKMGLPAGRKRSTAVGALESLAAKGHEIASWIIEYRQLTKLKSTYLDALPGMILQRTSRIHTSYHQTGAATGRISSSEPNLQNIPIRTELGKRIRRAFQSPEGCLLLSADYSQVELRILAHLADDPGLIRAFQADEDIHSYTAREIFDIAEGDDVSSEYRRRAKAINFGLNYGMSAYGLAQRLGIGNDEAKDYIDRYFARYPNVLSYMKNVEQEAREKGFVTTLKGRKIPTIGVQSSNRMQQEAAVRAAINAPIQGTAADILKIAMVRADRMLEENQFQSKMILTVHDEVIFEVPESETGAMQEQVRDVMESVVTLKVPLKVDMATGKTWADL